MNEIHLYHLMRVGCIPENQVISFDTAVEDLTSDEAAPAVRWDLADADREDIYALIEALEDLITSRDQARERLDEQDRLERSRRTVTP